MQITRNTIDVLKNFSEINSSILVEEGNTIKTISPMKNILAKADVGDAFEQRFAIYDLMGDMHIDNDDKEPPATWALRATIKNPKLNGKDLIYGYLKRANLKKYGSKYNSNLVVESNSLSKSGLLSWDMPTDWTSTTMKNLFRFIFFFVLNK